MPRRTRWSVSPLAEGEVTALSSLSASLWPREAAPHTRQQTSGRGFPRHGCTKGIDPAPPAFHELWPALSSQLSAAPPAFRSSASLAELAGAPQVRPTQRSPRVRRLPPNPSGASPSVPHLGRACFPPRCRTVETDASSSDHAVPPQSRPSANPSPSEVRPLSQAQAPATLRHTASHDMFESLAANLAATHAAAAHAAAAIRAAATRAAATRAAASLAA
jgi:hypothetical protein